MTEELLREIIKYLGDRYGAPEGVVMPTSYPFHEMTYIVFFKKFSAAT